MEFQCQIQAIQNLHQIVESNRHAILISGCGGCGKTHLVKEWAKLLQINDVAVINPSVGELKSVIDTLLDNKAPAVICIENLDEGVVQASYPLLKFLEECPDYLYVAVTCTNIRSIPETIISRCILIDVAMPTQTDLDAFAETVNFSNYMFIKDTLVWKCAKSFSDVKTILDFDSNKLAYFESLSNITAFKENVSSIAWKLQHYPDNSESPIVLVIRYLMLLVKPNQIKSCLDCLNDLQSSHISTNAVICKFVFENKYCE